MDIESITFHVEMLVAAEAVALAVEILVYSWSQYHQFLSSESESSVGSCLKLRGALKKRSYHDDPLKIMGFSLYCRA